MTDLSRNPMGVVQSYETLGPNTINFGRIIPERFPPYSFPMNKFPLAANKCELARLFDLHFKSSLWVAPVLEEHSCRSMLQKSLSKKDDAFWFADDDDDDAPPIVKAMVFAVAALSTTHNENQNDADFYFHLARISVEKSGNVESFEFVLANTLLVCSFANTVHAYSR